jgi:hypothetical protein
LRGSSSFRPYSNCFSPMQDQLHRSIASDGIRQAERLTLIGTRYCSTVNTLDNVDSAALHSNCKKLNVMRY